MKNIKILIGIYILAGIVTFGHAWKENPHDEQAKIIAAPVCSVLWPLYWSTIFWDKALA